MRALLVIIGGMDFFADKKTKTKNRKQKKRISPPLPRKFERTNTRGSKGGEKLGMGRAVGWILRLYSKSEGDIMNT